MARLAEDLIVEILLKLPVKSLLRFRCVCKSWFHLIKSTSFIDRHIKHHKNNDSILVFRGLEDRSINLLSLHSYESLSIISPHLEIPHFSDNFLHGCGPCDGLICLSDHESIVLCNPSIREFKVVPPRPFPCPEGWRLYVRAIGFGFDSNRNDYKILALVHLRQSHGNDYITKAEIYNVTSNSWREIDHDRDLTYVCHTPVYGAPFNGALHWIASSEGIDNILSFEMNTELFRDMELPGDLPVEYGKRKSLMVLNDSLALFACTFPYSNSEKFVDIWVMHEYGVAISWTKQVSIGPVTGIQRPLLLWKNEAILLESTNGRLVSCALDTREMNDFEIHGVAETMGLMVYNESLVSTERWSH